MTALLALMLLQTGTPTLELDSATMACLEQVTQKTLADLTVAPDAEEDWTLVKKVVASCDCQIQDAALQQLPQLAKNDPSLTHADISEALKDKAQYLVAYMMIDYFRDGKNPPFPEEIDANDTVDQDVRGYDLEDSQ
ncbi:hypothetical protein ACR9YC_00300 [Parasphingorhabdus sp. DH2-15]|uniref:hypothetical protein n=1 Tax=Parasphingorhabdus sp. DH2-15 TaxID=3444112 RepID=UPI003F688FB4